MVQKNIVATAHTNADVYGVKAMKLLKFLQSHVLRAFTCITLRAEKKTSLGVVLYLILLSVVFLLMLIIPYIMPCLVIFRLLIKKRK